MKRRHRSALIGSLLALAAGGFASGADALEPYRVVPGDVLQVSIYGETKLSGRFRVGPDGAIGFPLLGAFPVAGLSTSDITRRLEEALAERIPAGSPAAVEVAEHAPIYVLGDVDRPGPVPFTPDMRVLEVVASAGGLRRPREVDGALLPLISAEQELADLRLTHFTGQVQRARLTAELDGRAFAASDVPLDALVATESMKRVIAAEVELFAKRKALLEGQDASLRAQRDSFDAEIDSLRQGIALYEEEVRLLSKEADKQDALLNKGLTVEQRVTAVRREQAALQRSLLEARSFLARAMQKKLEVQQRLEEVHMIRKRDDVIALRELEAVQARIERKILSAGAALDELRQKGPGVVEEKTTTIAYVLVRREEGGRRSVVVDDLAEVRPGDVLRVERRAPLKATAAAEPTTRAE